MPPTTRANAAAPDPTIPTPPDANRGLVTKLAEVMDAMGRVPKTGWNSFHKYAYATEGDVSEGLRHELGIRNVSLKVAVDKWERQDHPATSSGRVQWLWIVYMTFTLTDGDTGQAHVVENWPGIGIDSDDKGIYKAMTGAQKYWMMKTFMVATGDDPEDVNRDERERAQGKSQPQPRPQERQRSARPISQNKIGTLHGKITAAGGDHDVLSRIVICSSNGTVFSVKDLPEAGYDAVVSWIERYAQDKDETEALLQERFDEHPDWLPARQERQMQDKSTATEPTPEPAAPQVRHPPGSPAADDDDIPF